MRSRAPDKTTGVDPSPDRALHRACEALQFPESSQFSPAEASVFLKYLLLGALEDGTVELKNWRGQLWQHPDQSLALRRYLNVLLKTLKPALHGPAGGALAPRDAAAVCHALDTSATYRSRMLDLVLEAALSERLAPETCIDPAPVAPRELDGRLQGQWNHAVVFAAAPLFTHEFYPLAVDAFARDSDRYGKARFNILGVHVDWLDPHGRISRVLYLDLERERFGECALKVPLVPDSAQFMCLGRRERQLHPSWSARLDCPQVNPAAGAVLADDKARTLKAWAHMGLEIPAFQVLHPGDDALAGCFVGQFPELVVKPNQGTEGEGVAFFPPSAPASALKDLLSVCWEQGDALLQTRRDGVLFQDSDSGKKHTLALRFNVSFDGRRHHLESAYAQIGASPENPASAGQGGKLLDLAAIRSCLVQRQGLGDAVVSLSAGVWRRIHQQTERAASLFPDLLLVGLDLVLDLDRSGVPVPVFLEANPRPAGLSHAHFVQEDGLPGVSLKLWDGLEHLYEHRAVDTAA